MQILLVNCFIDSFHWSWYGVLVMKNDDLCLLEARKPFADYVMTNLKEFHSTTMCTLLSMRIF